MDFLWAVGRPMLMIRTPLKKIDEAGYLLWIQRREALKCLGLVLGFRAKVINQEFCFTIEYVIGLGD